MGIRVITVSDKRCSKEQHHIYPVQYSIKSDGFPDKIKLKLCDVTRSLYILNGYFCVSDLGESCKSLKFPIRVVCKSPYICKNDVCSE